MATKEEIDALTVFLPQSCRGGFFTGQGMERRRAILRRALGERDRSWSYSEVARAVGSDSGGDGLGTKDGFGVRVSRSVPHEVLKRYEKWKDIARISGPKGLRLIKGFHDEALSGQWRGFRSSRLNRQWRVIYRVRKDVLQIQVVEVNPHDYSKK